MNAASPWHIVSQIRFLGRSHALTQKILLAFVWLLPTPALAQGGDSTTVPVDPASFKHAGVTDAWSAYAEKLTFGKGQTLALLDDGCKLSMPEWSQSGGPTPKVLVAYDSVDRDDDPKHEG